MTRPVPTDNEIAIRNALEREYGSEIEFEDREEEDRPDFLFKLNGRLIACEATQVPQSEILQYNYKRGLYEVERTKSVGVQVVWAIEPHVWIAKAIISKRRKIVEYKKRTGASNVWLIAHTLAGSKDRYIRADQPWQFQMMQFGAASVAHGFKSVYFWDEVSGFSEVFRRGRSHKRPVLDLTDGYPSNAFTVFSSGEIKTSEEGASPVEYDFGEIEISQLIIPPFDPKFRKHQPKSSPPKRQGLRATAYDTHIDMSLYDLD
ncbi:hypothetical protein [Ruegeria sp. THAF33]|uniref:hypothetical protein n=1 Tax=Ruegeria sp. THAF33 TaxID=2587853 RepID=UPI0012690C84|nr:hypothetical protein [Ruegeria sp. THAF33]QFT74029.1 hypothetical protein FIU92_13405 [Ruegeria sp. THAF33]